MCTLSILLRPATRLPLIVAANRDESAQRPTRAPHVWENDPPFVAGQDLLAGGTWMGVNACGVFVGLTNLWSGTPPDPSRASRGEVVRRLLDATSLQEAIAIADALDPEATNPYLLVCAGARGRGFVIHTADGLRRRDLPAGLYSFGNLPPESPGTEKLERAAQDIRTAWESGGGEDDPQAVLSALTRALGTHHGRRGPTESLCVHTAGEYGTVSSSVLMLGEDVATAQLHYAPGPPCVTPFEDLSATLRSILRPPTSGEGA